MLKVLAMYSPFETQKGSKLKISITRKRERIRV